jgi:hypothetical protein
MAIELRLPTGAPAHYEWLSNAIYIDDATPIELFRLIELNTDSTKDDSLHLTAPTLMRYGTDLGTISSPNPWSNVQEAIADLSMRHEFSHYAQDLTTGVGHWDELIFRSEFVSLVGMYSDRQDWSHYEDIRSDIVEKTFERFFVLVPPHIEDTRKRRRASFLKRARIADLPPGGDVGSFGIASLLEADAIAEVVIHASDLLHHGDQAVRLLFDGDVVHLWNPFEMPSRYRLLFDGVRQVVMSNGVGALLDTQLGVIRLLRFIAVLLQQLIDLSLAYPAPSFFKGRPANQRKYFDPVVKFYCLLSAYNQMGATAGARLKRSLQENTSDFQDALLMDSPFRDIFPDKAEIYRGWETALLALEPDDVILSLRKHSAKMRQKENIVIRRSPLGSTILERSGLWWWNSRQLPVPLFSGDFASLMDVAAAQAVVLSRICDLRILDLLCHKKVMSCPIVGKNCAGEMQSCRDGIRDLMVFPREQCTIRHRYPFLLH